MRVWVTRYAFRYPGEAVYHLSPDCRRLWRSRNTVQADEAHAHKRGWECCKWCRDHAKAVSA